MTYTLSSHTARSVPSLTAHHHLEAIARTVPGGVTPRALRVRKAAATLAFTPFAKRVGGVRAHLSSIRRVISVMHASTVWARRVR